MDRSPLIAWVFMGLGAVALSYGAYVLHAARKSTSWPVVEELMIHLAEE